VCPSKLKKMNDIYIVTWIEVVPIERQVDVDELSIATRMDLRKALFRISDDDADALGRYVMSVVDETVWRDVHVGSGIYVGDENQYATRIIKKDFRMHDPCFDDIRLVRSVFLLDIKKNEQKEESS
jgi:hypothetical protein